MAWMRLTSETGSDVPVRPGLSLPTLDGGQLKLELVHYPLVSIMPHPIEELTSPASWALVRDFATYPRPFRPMTNLGRG
jgi:hypothetical protein